MTAIQYSIGLQNTYNVTEAPLVFSVGYVNQKSGTYNCITQMTTDDFVIYPYNNDMTIINTYTLQTGTENSYSVQMFDLDNTNPPIIYDFYVFNKVFAINQEELLACINRELPAIYNPNNLLNNADNIASAGVIKSMYNYMYGLFWNGLTSVGALTGYNSQYEELYIGATNFLQNATYPAAFLRTLMNINTQTSIQAFSIAQCLSRLIFQFTGSSAPVQVKYVHASRKYLINLFVRASGVWVLGDSTLSVLGSTTILGDYGTNVFLWIIYVVARRIMPAFVKWELQFIDPEVFNAEFDVAIVGASDFINPAIIYDAYEVVNNDNIFNTQGYLLNPGFLLF